MKIFHISDLHIGKQLHYYNLKENQRAVLQQIVECAWEYRPDVLLICGDIFDRPVPSGEAYTIFDEFLNEMEARLPHMPVLIIAGNHDNPQRLSYAGAFLEKHNIYISAVPPQKKEEYLKKVVIKDQWGNVNFYLLPFLKPGYVRHLFAEGQVTDYESAIKEILGREKIDDQERNVLLSHQFFTNTGTKPELCDSEFAVFQAGGLDNVDVTQVEWFDYVALGHIHGPQKVKQPHIRYCGTPLKYSISEENHKKSITMVTMEAKGAAVQVETIPLLPMQEVRKETGLLEEIIARATPENCHDFISVTITDEKELYLPKDKLEEVYDHILELRIDNQRTRNRQKETEYTGLRLEPMDVFGSFYEEMCNQPLSEEETEFMQKLLIQIGEESHEA